MIKDKMGKFEDCLLFIKPGWHRHIDVKVDISNFSESFERISLGY